MRNVNNTRVNFMNQERADWYTKIRLSLITKREYSLEFLNVFIFYIRIEHSNKILLVRNYYDLFKIELVRKWIKQMTYLPDKIYFWIKVYIFVIKGLSKFKNSSEGLICFVICHSFDELTINLVVECL